MIELPELYTNEVEEHPFYDQIRLMDNVLRTSGYEVPREEIAMLWEYFSHNLNVAWAPVSEDNLTALHEVLVELVVTNA